MPLQNRVNPFGEILAAPERGTFTGNRGIIHDPATRNLLRRRWAIKAWIICLCEFRGRKRQVMGPGKSGNGSWTELFFLDEVTALAAGHRPCFYCRREAANDYARRVGQALDTDSPRAGDIDRRLHAERLATGVPTTGLDYETLIIQPDGVMISTGGNAYAICNGQLLPWSYAGYGDPVPFQAVTGRQMEFITPLTSRLALSAGFEPVWHDSAGT